MPSRSRQKRKATEAAVAALVDPPPSPPPAPVPDEVDDEGHTTFISLSSYGALTDETEVTSDLRITRQSDLLYREQRRAERRQQRKEGKGAVVTSEKVGGKRRRGEDAANKPRTTAPSATPPPPAPAEPLPSPAPSTPTPPPPAEVSADSTLPLTSSPPAPLLSNFVCNDTKLRRNSNTSYTLTFHSDEFLTFHGSVDLTVDYGFVSINSAILSPSSPAPLHLHSPLYDPTALLCIRYYAPPSSPRDVTTITLSLSTSPHSLHSHVDRECDYLPIPIPSFHPLLRQLPTSQNLSPLSALTPPSPWSSLLPPPLPKRPSSSPPSYLLCGARAVGKSTFSRLLVNSLLRHHRRLLYLDLDCGQPEHTPPSLTSLCLVTRPLLSPTHTRQLRPLLSFFMGAPSYHHDPAWFIRAVSRLTQRVEEERRQRGERVPLIINTAGWLTGLGGVVLHEVMQLTRPLHVLYLGGEEAAPLIPSSSTLHRLPRGPAPPSSVPTPERLRTLSLLSSLLGRTAPPVSFLTAAAELARVVPYRLPIEGTKLSVVGEEMGVPAHLLLKVFNLSIVSLHWEEGVESPSQGLGLVRGVDSEWLYVITGVEEEVVEKTVHLVKGVHMEVPSVLVYLEGESQGQPYMPLNTSTAGIGGTTGRGRKNLPRKRLVPVA